ncbi:hypothetical protein E2C01_040613 [Portunus trituberculatus]|uniref:Uncharacterized protein n=1 Tax=Portunus trituberculatus TaxID=210409 RepID=A0A5B7FP86_PORTR|nr:hypothetical protein [Portunus trituberculatus]
MTFFNTVHILPSRQSHHTRQPHSHICNNTEAKASPVNGAFPLCLLSLGRGWTSLRRHLQPPDGRASRPAREFETDKGQRAH